MTQKNPLSSKKKPQILATTPIAHSQLFHIEAVDLLFANGEQRRFERMRPNNRQSVMIVPVHQQHLLLIREYAVGIDAYELGFPKGLVDGGEQIMQAANRELQEEIGFAASHWHRLATLTLAPAYFSNTMTIVLAQQLYPQQLIGDEPEPLEVVRWPINNMLALLQQADFREARSVSALFFSYHYLMQQGLLS